MPNSDLPITAIFQELVRQGYLTPPAHMEDMRLPGEFVSVPTVISYGTPDTPIRTGVHSNAELGQYSQRNLDSPSNTK